MPTATVPDGHQLRAIREGLFFIVGPHRAGTTLLQAMLSSHSALTVPPETGYFDQVWPRRNMFGDLNQADLLERAGQFINSPRCSVSDLGVHWPDVSQSLTATPRGYDDLFVVLMALYAGQRGKRRAGEKSPRHLFYISEIIELYPCARFVCLIRDPRAVVHSELATTWGSQSVSRITRRWCRVADAADRCVRTLPAKKFRLVRYEDLVSDPEAQLRGICDFLGEAFEPQMLQFHQRPASEQGFRDDEVWKQNTLRALEPGRIEQWQTGLTAAQIKLIESLAGARLEKFGYRPIEVSAGSFQRWSTWITDQVQWGAELVAGLFKGRRRRRPWSCVWRDVWGGR